MAKSIGLWGAGANLGLAECPQPSKDPVVHKGATLKRFCDEWWSTADADGRAKDALSARELKEARELAQR
eukprot:7540331-Pyramimonas_sp.AAC.1